MFAFGNKKRRPKLVHESISEPLTAAQTQYIESRGSNSASFSLYQDRVRDEERPKMGRFSFASRKPVDSISQYSGMISSGGERPKSSRFSKWNGEGNGPSSWTGKLRREQSSSTLHSYYDRKKYPLSITQQTSASSTRDLALRKGCPPVVPPTSAFGKQDSPLTPKSEAAKKRPSRLDLSAIFTKSTTRAEPIQSPGRHDDPTPQGSPSLRAFGDDTRSPPFLRDTETYNDDSFRTSFPSNATTRQMPHRTSFAPINVQKPSVRVQNWFDGLEGYVSDDDNHKEPEMQPGFVEKAFGVPYSEPAMMNKSMPDLNFRQEAEPRTRTKRAKSNTKPDPVTPTTQMTFDSRSSVTYQETHSRSRPNPRPTPASTSAFSTFSALSTANLHEESVLFLSSSDDEDQGVQIESPRRRLSRRISHIRDSMGADSIDSEVEICTAQAVQPSSLWSAKALLHSKSLPGGVLAQKKTKLHALKGSDIPSRRSSKRSVARLSNHDLFSGTHAGILKAPFAGQSAGESESSKRATRKAFVPSNRESARFMELTAQEASLLEAMRSKKAFMRQNPRNDGGEVADSSQSMSSLSEKSPRPRQRTIRSATMEHRPSRVNVETTELRRPPLVQSGTKESSLASERVSLIFSEALSSPTTAGRESPTTPPIDNYPDWNTLAGSDGFNYKSSPASAPARPGHSRCKTGSSNIVVLDHFHPQHKSKFDHEEYPWGLA